MCGLIYIKRFDGQSASSMAVKRYHSQSGRGKQSFGYVCIEDGKVMPVERFLTEASFLESLKQEKASEILIHHRLATSTENYLGTTHPVVVDDERFTHKYYVIHNGVLNNEYTLKHKHEALGLIYNTEFKKRTEVTFRGHSEALTVTTGGFLDSEALAKEVALYMEGEKETIDAIGSVAFIALQTDKEDNLLNVIWGRNEDRELVLEYVVSKKKKKKNKGAYMVIKSEGGGVNIQKDIIHIQDAYTTIVEKRPVTIKSTYTNRYTNQRQMGFDQTRTRTLPAGSTGTVHLIPEKTRHNQGTPLKRTLDWGAESEPSGNDIYDDISRRMDYDAVVKELERIEDEIVDVQSDIDGWRGLYDAETDEAVKNTYALEIELCEQQLEELKKKGREIEQDAMTLSPYTGEFYPVLN